MDFIQVKQKQAIFFFFFQDSSYNVKRRTGQRCSVVQIQNRLYAWSE